MFHLNKQKLIIAFLICLFVGSTKVLAFSCIFIQNEDVNDAVKNAVKNSTMVFTGKVVGFEYRKGIPNQYLELLENLELLEKGSGNRIDSETLVVKFQVEKWWKGEATTEVFLVTSQTKNSDGTSTSSDDYSFEKGKSYLVYAYGKENELRTDECTRTRLLTKTEDLKILGEGKEPVEKKDELNKIRHESEISNLLMFITFNIAI